MIIGELVEKLWIDHDQNRMGALTKSQTKRFVQDLLGILGLDTDISSDEFDLVFKHFDSKGNGTIDKKEMPSFIKLIIGAPDDDMEGIED